MSPNPPSGYDSWLDYWEQNSGGSHVQKVSSTDQKWYIMPLCDSCNYRADIPEVIENRLIDVPTLMFELTKKVTDNNHPFKAEKIAFDRIDLARTAA